MMGKPAVAGYVAAAGETVRQVSGALVINEAVEVVTALHQKQPADNKRFPLIRLPHYVLQRFGRGEVLRERREITSPDGAGKLVAARRSVELPRKLATSNFYRTRPQTGFTSATGRSCSYNSGRDRHECPSTARRRELTDTHGRASGPSTPHPTACSSSSRLVRCQGTRAKDGMERGARRPEVSGHVECVEADRETLCMHGIH